MKGDSASLFEWLAQRAPEGSRFAFDEIGEGILLPEEEVFIASAVRQRRNEFGTGRRLARKALAELGCPAVAIPVKPDRQPVWPRGYLGSITHSRSVAAAIVIPERLCIGIGLDIESAEPLPPDLRSTICFDGEPELVGDTPPDDVDLAKLCFVAKEAIFKAYYPATQTYLDFLDARVSIGWGQRTFDVALVNDRLPHPEGSRGFRGFIDVLGGHVIAVAWISRN